MVGFDKPFNGGLFYDIIEGVVSTYIGRRV